MIESKQNSNFNSINKAQCQTSMTNSQISGLQRALTTPRLAVPTMAHIACPIDLDQFSADTSSQIQPPLLLGKTFLIASTQHQCFLSSVMANLAHLRQPMIKLLCFPLFLSHNPLMKRPPKHIPVHFNILTILPLPPGCWITGFYLYGCLTLLL